MFVKNWCQWITADVMQTSFVSASLFNQIIMFTVTWIITLQTFYLVSSKSFLNFEIVLFIIVHLFYDLIHQVDY